MSQQLYHLMFPTLIINKRTIQMTLWEQGQLRLGGNVYGEKMETAYPDNSYKTAVCERGQMSVLAIRQGDS